MADSSDQKHDPGTQTGHWLAETFAAQWTLVLETMTGVRPLIEISGQEQPETAVAKLEAPGTVFWKQGFAIAGTALAGALWLGAAEADWTTAGKHILLGAGLGEEDSDTESVRSSYLETLAQSMGALAQAITARAGRELTPASGGEAAVDPAGFAGGFSWIAIRCDLGGTPATVYFACEATLATALESLIADYRRRQDSGTGREGAADLAEEASLAIAGRSKTFGLLLDVELPVSVSFGGADILLKDVLKLTTGSIVELNRTLIEPVDIVVNNCTIARGEVVVIEGNFGVRVHEVISRQERLRTLR